VVGFRCDGDESLGLTAAESYKTVPKKVFIGNYGEKTTCL